MSRSLIAAFVTALLLTAVPAAAQPRADECVVGPGLAATLLYPYFEVNPTSANAPTTLIAISNGLFAPALTRVVLWTDWAVPTLAFDVYLEGFDIQTINLRDVFNGIIPSTGASADLSGYPFCGSLAPFHANPALTMVERQQLAALHTGIAGPMNPVLCAGAFYGDGNLRGYVTVDVVDECSGVEAITPIFTPANTVYPYFADGGGAAGIATTDNTLWGDVIYVDPTGNFASANEAIALWADPVLFSGSNIFTFYGRYSGWDGRDDRVPLPYRWDQRFANGGPLAGGARMLVWRDTGSASTTWVTCGTTPSWWPLDAFLGAMDEDAGNFMSLNRTACPDATQSMNVSAQGIPYAFGWIQIDVGRSQAWVETTLSAEGRYSVTLNGMPVEFLCGLTAP